MPGLPNHTVDRSAQVFRLRTELAYALWQMQLPSGLAESGITTPAASLAALTQVPAGARSARLLRRLLNIVPPRGNGSTRVARPPRDLPLTDRNIGRIRRAV